MPLIFQYGSNCDAKRLNDKERLAGDAKDLGSAQTHDEYELAFNKWSTKGKCAAADLVKPRKDGRRILGILYEVSKAGFKKLKEEIEGPSYRPQSITVVDMTGTTKTVKTFRVRRDARRRNLSTTADYVRHIVRGLRAHEVPEEYVQHVIDVALDTNRRATQASNEQNRLIESLRIPS